MAARYVLIVPNANPEFAKCDIYEHNNDCDTGSGLIILYKLQNLTNLLMPA